MKQMLCYAQHDGGAQHDGQGSRWRFCAECGKPILVNVGSRDDRDGLRCRDCEIEAAWGGFRVFITRDPQLLAAAGLVPAPDQAVNCASQVG